MFKFGGKNINVPTMKTWCGTTWTSL